MEDYGWSEHHEEVTTEENVELVHSDQKSGKSDVTQVTA